MSVLFDEIDRKNASLFNFFVNILLRFVDCSPLDFSLEIRFLKLVGIDNCVAGNDQFGQKVQYCENPLCRLKVNSIFIETTTI